MTAPSPERPGPGPDRSFLGTGWSFPVTLDGDGGVALAGHEEDVRQSVLIILSTNLGERVMRPVFGSDVRRFVFDSASTTRLALLQHRVTEALVRWEPRIDVDEVTVTVPPSTVARVDVDIAYRVRATNTFYNLVYPFYLDEAHGDATVDTAQRRQGVAG
ncbi:GPW/gp25 family protein [Georgenia sp. 311]|uniref:GPW/gp25 family protein n=1 Tax=Georgenia wutianyii TaxID=2585135 RepID=A0ABX5VLM8_9MICO|nr:MULTISPECIES: GPW/gp25 family protein [Georgenia]QDB79392.1 GPW/gp25 family protein [Georgenia wutianyii]TNC19555.1 GPW/gp25 family protein [Georgenia sp. 311]